MKAPNDSPLKEVQVGEPFSADGDYRPIPEVDWGKVSGTYYITPEALNVLKPQFPAKTMPSANTVKV